MKIIIEVELLQSVILRADLLEEIGAIIAETPSKHLEAHPLILEGGLAKYTITVEQD